MSQTAEILRLPTTDQGIAEWESKIDLVRRTVAAGASSDELELFFHQARRAGLDPLAKQIYYVKRQGKGTVQVGIDGLRLIADRTGQYAGADDVEYGPEDDRGFPSWARATVYKMVAGVRCPFAATTRWGEYYPGDQQGFQWKRMPYQMLGKTAEALALRKGFPADMGGLLIHEETQQAEEPMEAEYRDLSSAEPTTVGTKAAPAPEPAPAVVDVLDAEGVPEASKRGGQEAFGYRPTAWPQPKTWGAECEPKQIAVMDELSLRHRIDRLTVAAVRATVLAAYGLAPGTTKAKMALFIDFLKNAGDDAVRMAVDKAAQGGLGL